MIECTIDCFRVVITYGIEIWGSSYNVYLNKVIFVLNLPSFEILNCCIKNLMYSILINCSTNIP
ncbi:hypothetical protein FWK35_00034702 [Aphis craccivora]|uniref:Uncharacterized protein n=1 Tax=Aphis craccivora TaxID=307492 RepID=A0A6G0WWD9_APHCR|nr:hypothetical protein FWK35_00034702 [Aphis craccivora]